MEYCHKIELVVSLPILLAVHLLEPNFSFLVLVREKQAYL